MNLQQILLATQLVFVAATVLILWYRLRKANAYCDYMESSKDVLTQAIKLCDTLNSEYRKNPTHEEIYYQLASYEQKRKRYDKVEQKFNRTLTLVK